jgi:exodeoxyribonuclease III
LEDDDENMNEDYDENLTFHEDSLSVMQGWVSTPVAEDIPVWITTDSGSMTQLIQAEFARRLKLKILPILDKQQFKIASPGGGEERVNTFVELAVTIKGKQLEFPTVPYNEVGVEEELIEIKMKFAICESLPVPILWGGAQMRQHDLLDHHAMKMLSLLERKGGNRYVTPSVSWLVAANEMAAITDPRIKKAYKEFIPSKDRLTNMIKGERVTINMPARLYPGRDNIVRVGRHNARVDEGYNEIVALNQEEVTANYGGWLTVMDCVANGEAHIIVRNNASRAITLGAGDISIAIRPAICLPRILTASAARQFEEDEDEGPVVKTLAVASEEDAPSREGEGGGSPKTFMTWNCNGLVPRMKRRQLEDRFYRHIKDVSPDILSLQEVRLQGDKEDLGRVDEESDDAVYWEKLMAPLREEYSVYLSLCKTRYAGQAVLVKKTMSTPTVTYNWDGEEGYEESGRFVKLAFPDLTVRSVYVPYNGRAREDQLDRRQKWDAALKREVSTPAEDPSHGRVLMGDMNAVYRDSDISPHPEFWKRHAHFGLGVADGDQGFGGTTKNERARLRDMLEASAMADTFTTPHPDKMEEKWTFRGQGMFFGKGMKLDYIFADDSIMLSGGVQSSRILGNSRDREDFMGSDHAPLVCTLHPRWQCRKANLLAHYEAAVKEASEEGSSARSSEDSWRVKAMHVNSAIRRLNPEAQVVPKTARPAAFPMKLWKLVAPLEQVRVPGRFKRFKSEEYLLECIAKVETNLDIHPRNEWYSPAWKPVEDEEEWLQEDVLRAQAIANLDIFFFPNPEEVAMAKDVIAEIETMDGRPHNCRGRKLSVVQKAFLHAKTNIMLRARQLEEAKSDWCHGLVLVAYEDRINAFMEKHGEAAMERLFEAEHEAEVATFFRLCVDLRMLNSKTIPDRFPLPRIDDLLESIPRDCSRFSISDIADAFFKCELKKEDRHKTAFKTHDRHLQFAVLPQGFINSPSIFCRLIARTFEGMDRQKFSAYIDDVLNHTDDFADHLGVQQGMYDRLRDNQLTLKLSKTHLNYGEVKFLGHILTKQGRLPDPKAVEAIREWKDPTTAKEVRSFLGATLYYREYIHEYSDMAMPLYNLIKKGVVVDKTWSDDTHGKAVQRIKDALTSKPVLMQVDNTKPFRLKVDACRVGRGIGGILEQQNNQGKWQPVSYFSSSLSKEERNYSATELECKALHDCILHYATYLKYIPHFEVFSDHNALRYMVNSDNSTTNGRLMRYILDLQEYNFAIYYRKGTENCDADAVSRLKRTADAPVYLSEEELDQENGVISPQMLHRARSLDMRNRKLEKEARHMLSRLAKQELKEMALINDHILAEGVENLESESGRARFFENLQKTGLKCSRTKLDETLDVMAADQGTPFRPLDEGLAEVQVDGPAEPACLALASILNETGGLAEEEKAMLPSLLVNQVRKDGQEELRLPYYEEYEKMDSGATLPCLLANLVDWVTIQAKLADHDAEDLATEGRMVNPRPDLDVGELLAKRGEVVDRTARLSKDTTHSNKVLVATRRAKKVAEEIAKAEMAAEEDKGEDDATESPAVVSKNKKVAKPQVKKGTAKDKKGAVKDKTGTKATTKAPVEEDSSDEETVDPPATSMKKKKMAKPPDKKGMVTGKAGTMTIPRNLRKRIREINYLMEAKTQPNWKRDGVEPVRAAVNQKLEATRRRGYGRLEVLGSLVAGDSGNGLYATKPIKANSLICTYEGVEIPLERIKEGIGDRDYVASAIKNHKTQELVYVDADLEDSCYGRFAQDPIDDHLVNAKLLWVKGKIRLVATCDIDPGDEIYLEYGLAYWRNKLDCLHPHLRARIEEKCKRRTVEFQPEVTVAEFKDSVTVKHRDGLRIREEGELLQRTPDNLLTRADRYITEEEIGHNGPDEESEPELPQEVLDSLSFDNVEETLELADELRFLNGRKFEDEGRLYEIWQVRYDPQSERVIGFRRPLSGKTNIEDGSPFLVFGIEGLYELSERYLLTHPEDRSEVPWPTTGSEWAKLQREDDMLSEIWNEIEAAGGFSLKISRTKYCLDSTDGAEGARILVREVADTRKGVLRQTMVPRRLVPLTLRVHHEGFAHMGANRMLETIRLRYFWSKMDEDIQRHTGKCINCKLRKSYQRRPRVPIMKYDDTSRPLDRVHVDLTGPLPETKAKNKYVMVIKDYLTKYVWLVPLKTKGAVEVAEAFVGEFICLAGVPGRVVSDKGNEFVNRLLTNVSRILNINRVSTTPYNPRSDGFVENHNKTLKDQLYHYVDNLKQDDWDVFLPTVQLMYNTTVSLATGFTPMLLMTGREARMPSFSHMASVDLEKHKSVLSNEFVLKTIESMRAYHDFALKQTVKNKERLNVRVRKPLEFVEYEPGQQFLRVRRPISTFKSAEEKEEWKISMKLLERYEGPYKIVRKISPVLYDADVDGKEVRVHAGNMKPF